MKLVKVQCKKCGKKIEVNPELEKANCNYCGSEVSIKEELEKNKKETTNKKESSSTNKDLMLKIVIGVCILLVIVVICLLVFMKKDNNSGNNDNNENKSSEKSNNSGVKGTTIEELRKNMKAESDSYIEALENEYKSLTEEISDYSKYKTNASKVEAYYKKVVDDCDSFAIKIREYALKYANVIVNSNTDIMTKYNDMEDMYDDIYSDVSEDMYDDIYSGILEDMYDFYYSGILEKIYNKIPYKEYSSARSNEYSNYSDARSDVYRTYSDVRSDVYRFYSKLRSKLYSGDLDKVKEEIEDFEKDLNKLK